MDDHTCLKRIKQGGKAAREAITILYERYAKSFYRWLRKHRLHFTHEDSEEIIQNTFIRLTRQTNVDFTLPDYPRPWLYRILTNCAIDFHRRRPMETPNSDLIGNSDQGPPLSPADAQAGSLITENDCTSLLEAFQAFQKDHPEPGDALELVMLEGWSIRELAQYLGKSEGATREFLSYWRKQLRNHLCRHCTDYLDYHSDTD